MRIHVYVRDRDAHKMNEKMGIEIDEKRVVAMEINRNVIGGYYYDEDTGEISIFTTVESFVCPYSEHLLKTLERVQKEW
jgi:hypothetical protein